MSDDRRQWNELCRPGVCTVSGKGSIRHDSARQVGNGSHGMGFVGPAVPIVLATAAAILEGLTRLKESREADACPPGRMIGLSKDGRRLHVVYHAPSSLAKRPCVIFEAGANCWSSVWEEVAVSIGKVARVVRYDRLGFGYSDALSTPSRRDVTTVAGDLVEILRVLNVAPPYIFVAHSLGALYANVAMGALGRGNVAGVVYVDAALPETVRRLRRVVPQSIAPSWLARMLGAFGILRVISPVLLRPYVQSFKGKLLRESRMVWARGNWLVSYTSEWANALKAVARGGRLETMFEGTWLGDTPVAVLIPDIYDRTNGKEYVSSLQEGVARYSEDSVIVHVRNCGHFVQIDRPEVVVEAILSVIARSEQKQNYTLGYGDAQEPDNPLICNIFRN